MLKMSFWDSTTDKTTEFVGPDFESCMIGLVDTLGLMDEDFAQFMDWIFDLCTAFCESADGSASITRVPDDMSGDTIVLEIKRVGPWRPIPSRVVC